jgi:hypothetical protein
MSTQKSDIDRRSLIAGVALLGATLGGRPALAQQVEQPSVERLRETVSNPQLREKLLEEMDLLVSVAAVTFSMAKKENPPAAARAAYLALRGVLDSDGRAKVIEAALSSGAAPETVKRTFESIRGTLPKLRDLLTKDAGLSEPLADRLVGAFNVFTNLVAFAPANSDHWWCRCYGLGVIC